jgi:hypothetical protein
MIVIASGKTLRKNARGDIAATRVFRVNLTIHPQAPCVRLPQKHPSTEPKCCGHYNVAEGRLKTLDYGSRIESFTSDHLIYDSDI